MKTKKPKKYGTTKAVINSHCKKRTAQISMAKNIELIAPIPNCLLAFLPDEELRRLLPAMEKVGLNYGENIYERGDVIGDVYFPDIGKW